MKRYALVVAVGIGVLGVAAGGHWGGARARAMPKAEAQSAVFEPGRFPGLDLGVPGTIAGLLYLRAISDYGSWARGAPESLRPNYRRLAQQLLGIMRLDPRQQQAAELAGPVVGLYGEETAAGHQLLLLAIDAKLTEWRPYFWLGILHYTKYGDIRRAAQWWELAAWLPGSPSYLPSLAQLTLLQVSGDVSALLTQIDPESLPTPELREEWKGIRRFAAERERLMPTLDVFQQRFGHPPRDLRDVVAAGLWPSVPRDPWGGEMRLSADGRQLLVSDRAPVFLRPRHVTDPLPRLTAGRFTRWDPMLDS